MRLYRRSLHAHLALAGLGAFGTLVLVATLVGTAVAQSVPVPQRVVQDVDGTLYLVQGGNVWPLVPDQIGEAELAALKPGGEIDGTIPANLLPVAAPTFAGPSFLDGLVPTAVFHAVPVRGQVSIGGHTYQHGLQSMIADVGDEHEGATYAIPEGAHRFSAAIGNDDNQPYQRWQWTGLPLTYEVFLDGRRVASAHALGETHEPAIDVDVSGATSLEIKISAPLTGGATLADWGDPQFT